jgi:hypothetical protein
MTDFDPKLGVLVSGNDIVVVLTGSIYTVTYFKQRGSHGLLAKNIPDKDDPRIPMTAAEFLAKAWKAANQKAKSWAGYREATSANSDCIQNEFAIS